MSSESALTELKAIERLVKIAKGDTGQSRRVANFLLAWWNAGDNGGFDFTDLWNVDQSIVDDMLVVFGMVARMRAYPDAFGFEAEFRMLVTDWRSGSAKVGAYPDLLRAVQSASNQCGNVIFNCEQRPADNERHLNSWRSVKDYLDAALKRVKA